MLALSIITSTIVFLCIFWIRFSLNYVDSIKGFQGFLNSSPYELAGIILMISIPVVLCILILIFTYIIFFIFKNKSIVEQITLVNNKISSTLEVIARRMIESVKISYSSEFFKVFPMIMEDLADTLTDIITRSGIASELIISSEMEKYGNNRIIATCRIVLSLKDTTADFDENFRRALKRNESLLASVDHFKESYDKLLDTTKNYDHDKFLYSTLETGVVGKVYLILSRLSEMNNTRDNN